jgi:hypothetical protein
MNILRLALFGLLLLVFGGEARGSRHEIPFEWENGLIWVKVTSKGKKLNFVVDSGAGATVLSYQTVQRLRLPVGEPWPLYGAGVQSVAYAIGDFKGSLHGVPLATEVFAVPLRKLKGRGWKYRKMDGMIGQDFFRGRIVEIDYKNRRLTLLDSIEKRAKSHRLPLRYAKDAMLVPVRVDGSQPQWVRLDTGCVSALEWVAGNEPGRRQIEAEVRLGSSRCSPVQVGVHGKPLFEGEGGLLGNGLLSLYRVTIDARAMQLILEAP